MNLNLSVKSYNLIILQRTLILEKRANKAKAIRADLLDLDLDLDFVDMFCFGSI